MKKIKNNLLTILSMGIIIILFVISLILFYKFDIDSYHNCVRQMAHLNGLVCNKINVDAFTLFFYLLTDNPLNFIIYLQPILTIIPALYLFFKKYKSGYLNYMSLREKYSKIIKKEILKCYKAALIYPVSLLIILIILIFYTKNFKPTTVFGNYFFGWSSIKILKHFTTFFINIFLINIFFINIGLLVSKKCKNFILTIILSFLCIISYQIIAELFIAIPLSNLFKITNLANSFSIYNLWGYDSVVSYLFMIIYCLFLVGITSFLVYKTYKNKESVIISEN